MTIHKCDGCLVRFKDLTEIVDISSPVINYELCTICGRKVENFIKALRNEVDSRTNEIIDQERGG